VLRRLLRRLAGLLLAAVFGLGGRAAAQEGQGVTLGALLDLRVSASPTTTSFLDGGLGKVRYGGEGGERRFGFHFAQASLVLKATLSDELFARVQLNVDPEDYPVPGLSGVDIVEAYGAYRPTLSRTLGLRLKAGIFFPPVSLEHDGFAWSTTRTLTPSAVNSWIGEEVRATGLEGSLAVLLPSSDLVLTGAVFGGNDPDGSLMAWRGWALHDRQSGMTDRLPLAPLPDLGSDFPRQAAWTAPFREVDGRAGWYAAASWKRPQGVELRALYLDDGGDLTSVARGQYAWDTRFASIGARVPVGSFELLAQGVDGSTRMGPGPAVDVSFRAAYALAGVSAGRHRLALRGDVFETVDEKGGEYSEHGWALTACWTVTATEKVRLVLEGLRVDSTRPTRYDLGLPARAVETLWQAALRIRY
jgi:hypothetical protein